MRRRTMTTVATLFGLATSMVLLLPTVGWADGGYPPAPKPPVVSQTLPAPAPVRVARQVAFTGADILRWVVVAAVLVALGALLLIVNRRRRVSA